MSHIHMQKVISLIAKGTLIFLASECGPIHLALNYLTGVLVWAICHEAYSLDGEGSGLVYELM